MSYVLVTLDDAKSLAQMLTSMGVGGGVLPYSDDPTVSGIYVPTMLGPFKQPEDGDKKFYHLRFANGADGFNCGLIRGLMEFAPTRWPLMLITEVCRSVGQPLPKDIPQPPPPPPSTNPAQTPPSKPTVLVGDYTGQLNRYYSVFGDDSPEGATYTDARGTFKKVVYVNVFAPGQKASYWEKQ